MYFLFLNMCFYYKTKHKTFTKEDSLRRLREITLNKFSRSIWKFLRIKHDLSLFNESWIHRSTSVGRLPPSVKVGLFHLCRPATADCDLSLWWIFLIAAGNVITEESLGWERLTRRRTHRETTVCHRNQTGTTRIKVPVLTQTHSYCMIKPCQWDVRTPGQKGRTEPQKSELLSSH